MSEITTVGLDLAKKVFQVHGADGAGRAVLFCAESLRGNPPLGRRLRQGAAPTLAARPSGGGGLGTDFDLDGGLIPAVSSALAARDAKLPRAEDNAGIIAVAHSLRAGVNALGEMLKPRLRVVGESSRRLYFGPLVP